MPSGVIVNEPASASRIFENAAGESKAREARPVDRAVPADQRGRVAVTDERVVRDAIHRRDANGWPKPGCLACGHGDPTDHTTAAERARTVVAHAEEGTLSTLAVDRAGTPFGSLVALAVDTAGRPVLSLSELAEHSRNLAADPHASIMVVEQLADGDGFRTGASRCSASASESPMASGTRHGRSTSRPTRTPSTSTSATLAFYRLQVDQVRWVGGSGPWTGSTPSRTRRPRPTRSPASWRCRRSST